MDGDSERGVGGGEGGGRCTGCVRRASGKIGETYAALRKVSLSKEVLGPLHRGHRGLT